MATLTEYRQSNIEAAGTTSFATYRARQRGIQGPPRRPPASLQARPEASFFEAFKENFLFPAEAGFAGRISEPSRLERFVFRPLTFLPRVAVGALGRAVEGANVLFTGVAEPFLAAAGEQDVSELKRLPETITEGVQGAFRKAGAPLEAPKYGEAWGESYYRPLVGEKPPKWMETVQDVALDTVIIVGPSALKQARLRRTAMQVANTPAQYEAARTSQLTGAAKTTPREITKIAEKRVAGVVQSVKKAPVAVKAGRAAVKEARGAVAVNNAAAAERSVQTPVEKLTGIIKLSKGLEKATRVIRHEEMVRRTGKFAAILERETGEKAFAKATGALKGEFFNAQIWPPPVNDMSPAEINSIVNQLRTSKKMLPLERLSAYGGPGRKGLWGLLHEGRIPQKAQMSLLEREFGVDFVRAVGSKRGLGERVTETVLDVANLPRTFLTSYDLSASLRQTYISGVRHPVKWSKSFAAQVKAFASEKNAISIQNGIRSSKYYEEAVRYKLYLPDVASTSGPLSARPEEFISRFARVIPGVKASERAFITMGNKMRFELFSKYAQMWEGTGKTAGNYKSLASYLNAVTGRGSLGVFEKQGAALNALLFSPRYLTSRFQVLAKAAQFPVEAAKFAFTAGRSTIDPVSKIAAGDLATFLGVNTSILAAADFFWGDDVSVELNPQSSDFGKVRIGNTRFEMWAGYQPLMKYAAQAWTGERKSAGTGKISEVGRLDLAGRFLRSKLAPIPSFIVDLKTGTSFVGDEITLASLKKPIPENLAFQRFFPLSGQEIAEAFAHQGGAAAWLTIPAATLGIGAGTWEPSSFQKLALQRDELGQKYYGEKWDDIGPVAQKFITRFNPELVLLEQEAKYERSNFSFVGDILKQQQISGKEVESQLPTSMQSEMQRLRISVGGLSRNIGNWQMNDLRFEQYKDLIAAEIAKDARILESESYTGVSDKFRQRRLENIVKRAKKSAGRKIRTEAIRQDTQTRNRPFFEAR